MFVTGANDLGSGLRYLEEGQSAFSQSGPDHAMGPFQRPLNYGSVSSGTQGATTFKTVTPGVLHQFQKPILKTSERFSRPCSGTPSLQIIAVCDRLFFQNPKGQRHLSSLLLSISFSENPINLLDGPILYTFSTKELVPDDLLITCGKLFCISHSKKSFTSFEVRGSQTKIYSWSLMSP